MSAQTHTDKAGTPYVVGMMPNGKLTRFASFEEYEAAYWAALIVSEHGQ